MLSKEARRYGEMAPLTHSEKLTERARDGDPEALETVLQAAGRHHYETVESVLLQAIPRATGLRSNEDAVDYVSVKTATLRYELARRRDLSARAETSGRARRTVLASLGGPRSRGG